MAEDSRRRVLVADDDGFASPGIAVLAAAVADAGHDVVVACPDDDHSGSGASPGPMHPDEHIDVRQVALADGDLVANVVDGPPAVCVIAGALGGFGDPPDLIVSGNDPGLNTGWATLHPGTVVDLKVPDPARADLRGTRVAGLAPFGVVRAAIVENDEGRLQMELRERTDVLPSDSAASLVAEGYAAISTIRGVRVDDPEALGQSVGDGPEQGAATS